MYFINEKFAVYLSCEKAAENSGHNLAVFEQPSFEGQINLAQKSFELAWVRSVIIKFHG